MSPPRIAGEKPVGEKPEGEKPGAGTSPGASRSRAARLVAALSFPAGLGMALLWIRLGTVTVHAAGLFGLLGLDFGHYWAQARAFRQGPPEAIYDLARLQHNRRDLLRHYSPRPPTVVRPSHTPYPAVFAALFTAFARSPPHLAFAAWTLLNLALAVGLGLYAARLYPPRQRPWVGVVVVCSYPVGLTVFLGQSQLLLAWAAGGCFLALTRGRDAAAGVCLGLLVLKPQYALPLALALLAKRRLRTLIAAAATALAILLVSLAVAGTAAMRAYPGAALAMGHWDPSDQRLAITWRAVVLFLRPGVGDGPSALASMILALLTLALAVAAWRGPWQPGSVRFTRAFTLTLSATLLANPILYPYGAAILALPLSSLYPTSRPLTRALILDLALLPALWFTLSATDVGGLLEPARLTMLLHLALFVAVALETFLARPFAARSELSRPAAA